MLEYQSVMQGDEGVRVWLETLARDGMCIIQGVMTSTLYRV